MDGRTDKKKGLRIRNSITLGKHGCQGKNSTRKELGREARGGSGGKQQSPNQGEYKMTLNPSTFRKKFRKRGGKT